MSCGVMCYYRNILLLSPQIAKCFAGWFGGLFSVVGQNMTQIVKAQLSLIMFRQCPLRE